MGQFLKYAFASCLGVFLAIGMLVFILFLFGTAAVSKPATKVTSNSVLKIALPQAPPELTNNVMMAPLAISEQNVLGLHQIIETIENAANDDKIRGIYLDPGYLYMGPASAELLRSALVDFRSTGKFVAAYANFYGQGPYYLASAADHIMVNPIGSVEFVGFSGIVTFYKDLLDKTGLEMQIYYAGVFKSASERYRRTEMSPESRLQTKEYIDAAYSRFLDGIAATRDIPATTLRTIANRLQAQSGQDAVDLGLIDATGYENEIHAWMANQMGLEDESVPNFIDINAYAQANAKSASGLDRVAIVYAEGTIVNGEGYSGTIGGKRYVEILDKLRKSDRIKAVVLRVNSRGGSILASDQILHAMRQLREGGKPVVVSMGDYAASGGYYISAFADSILAEPSTLTGSIGVYTMIPNPHAVLTDKLHMSFDSVKTGPYSAAFTPYFPWTDAENAFMQARTDEYYELFLSQVAQGRGMTRDAVHAIAQGRIWTAEQALDHGLIDAIGNLDDAINAAANLAGIEDVRRTEYPKLGDPWTRFLNDLTGLDPYDISQQYLDARATEIAPELMELLELLRSREPVAHLPLVIRN